MNSSKNLRLSLLEFESNYNNIPPEIRDLFVLDIQNLNKKLILILNMVEANREIEKSIYMSKKNDKKDVNLNINKNLDKINTIKRNIKINNEKELKNITNKEKEKENNAFKHLVDSKFNIKFEQLPNFNELNNSESEDEKEANDNLDYLFKDKNNNDDSDSDDDSKSSNKTRIQYNDEKEKQKYIKNYFDEKANKNNPCYIPDEQIKYNCETPNPDIDCKLSKNQKKKRNKRIRKRLEKEFEEKKKKRDLQDD